MWDAEGAKAAGGGREDVLRRAREQREQRARARVEDAAAAQAQRLARGWVARRALRRAWRDDLAAKQADVDKVRAVLAAAGQPPLVLPALTLHALLRQLNAAQGCGAAATRFWHDRALELLEADADAFLDGSESLQWRLRMGRFLRRAVELACRSSGDADLLGLASALLGLEAAAVRRWALHELLLCLPAALARELERVPLPVEGEVRESAPLSAALELCTAMLSAAAREGAPETGAQALRLLCTPVLEARVAPQRVRELGAAEDGAVLRAALAGARQGAAKGAAQGVPATLWLLGNLLGLADAGVELSELLLATLGDLLLLVPEQTFAGNMAVLWVSRDTCVGMPESLRRQLGVLTGLGLWRRLVSEGCLAVAPELRAARRAARARDWAATAKALEDKANSEPSLKAPASKGMVSRLRELGSSWGARLLGGAGRRRSSTEAAARAPLQDQSSLSRQLATAAPASTAAAAAATESNAVLRAAASSAGRQGERPFELARAAQAARVVAVFLTRWPTSQRNAATAGLLNAVAFSGPDVCDDLWTLYEQGSPAGLKLARQDTFSRLDAQRQGLLLPFCAALQHALLVTDDAELYEAHQPLHLGELERVIAYLRQLLYQSITAREEAQSSLGAALCSRATKLLNSLYERHSRQPLCTTKTWLVRELNYRDGIAGVSGQAQQRVVREMPYAIPFAERVRLFHRLVEEDRALHQPQGAPSLRFTVRRETIFEDGFRHLGRRKADLRRRLYVVFVNAAGHEEAGIDAGGLFKEFWTQLSRVAFDAQYGLFKVTEDQLLYPNPQSELIHGPEHLDLLEFLGSIVGKALYEEITIQPRFARFFLSKFLGRFSFIGDLPSLDMELYKNLCFLKSYDGDIRDLCLTFSVTENDLSQQQHVDLIAGGSSTEVTSHNKFRYINLVANYHLNVRGAAQSAAFLRGFTQIIRPEWVSMFTQPELQTLISGASGAFSLDDLRKHTVYANGYHSLDRTVARFWRVVGELSDEDRARLLQFVTSCERPPLLGFGTLQPPFCISKVPVSSDDDKLVAASTCFNILKLPTYSSAKVMKAKLLLSIRSGAGFEMS